MTYKWREPESYDTGLRELESAAFERGLHDPTIPRHACGLETLERGVYARGLYAGAFFRWFFTTLVLVGGCATDAVHVDGGGFETCTCLPPLLGLSGGCYIDCGDGGLCDCSPGAALDAGGLEDAALPPADASPPCGWELGPVHTDSRVVVLSDVGGSDVGGSDGELLLARDRSDGYTIWTDSEGVEHGVSACVHFSGAVRLALAPTGDCNTCDPFEIALVEGVEYVPPVELDADGVTVCRTAAGAGRQDVLVQWRCL
jgi:hypothetical protein